MPALDRNNLPPTPETLRVVVELIEQAMEPLLVNHYDEIPPLAEALDYLHFIINREEQARDD